jgi:hypothetical protein
MKPFTKNAYVIHAIANAYLDVGLQERTGAQITKGAEMDTA